MLGKEDPTSSGQSLVRLVGCWGERATKDDRFRASYLTKQVYRPNHQLESYMRVKLLCQIITSVFLTRENFGEAFGVANNHTLTHLFSNVDVVL